MKLLHSAIQVEKLENAKTFFEGILGLKKVREYYLDSSLSNEIFGIPQNYKVFLYAAENASIEAFIGKKYSCMELVHIALEVKNREEILRNAKIFGLWVFEKERKGKDKLVFIKDFDNNLYELKKPIK